MGGHDNECTHVGGKHTVVESPTTRLGLARAGLGGLVWGGDLKIERFRINQFIEEGDDDILSPITRYIKR